MTASTGIAALQFYGGKTIHKWSGIGDGHLPRNTVLQNILTSNAFADVKYNIETTDTLVIDEIGMLSMQNFENIEYICRFVSFTYILIIAKC